MEDLSNCPVFQYSVEVSRGTSIVSEPLYIDLSSTQAASAVFPCDVDMDQILRRGLDQDYSDYKEEDQGLGGSSFEVAWYKDSRELSPSFMEPVLAVTESEVINRV